MVLDAEDGQFTVSKTLVRSVIQIDVGNFNTSGIKGRGFYGKSVVLGSNFDFVREQILDRMIGAPVTEFKFECPASESECNELVSKADSEHRLLIKQLADIPDSILNGVRIAGTIGEEYPVGMQCERFLCRKIGRDDG